MRITEIITERAATDTELLRRGWPGDEESRWAFDDPVANEPAVTEWRAIDVVKDILGSKWVSTDEDNIAPGQYYVYQSDKPFFEPTGEKGQGGAIKLLNPWSQAAKDVAHAAHESFHAWMHQRSGGTVWSNEKMVNQLAVRWLKKNLSGMALHVALSEILNSKISYGHN